MRLMCMFTLIYVLAVPHAQPWMVVMLRDSNCALSLEVRYKFPLAMHVAAQKVLDLGEFPDSGFEGGEALPASTHYTGNFRLYEEFPDSLEAKDACFQGTSNCFL